MHAENTSADGADVEGTTIRYFLHFGDLQKTTIAQPLVQYNLPWLCMPKQVLKYKSEPKTVGLGPAGLIAEICYHEQTRAI